MSSLQTASGRGQVLGPPITDDPLNGVEAAGTAWIVGWSGDAACAGDPIAAPKPNSPAAARPAPRRSASRTTPRYPNRNRLGETSPMSLGYNLASP